MLTQLRIVKVFRNGLMIVWSESAAWSQTNRLGLYSLLRMTLSLYVDVFGISLKLFYTYASFLGRNSESSKSGWAISVAIAPFIYRIPL